MAVGDALDQVLSELDAQQQERQQRRVPAPKPVVRQVPVSASAAPAGRASSSQPPSGGGPSFLSTVGEAVRKGVNTILPGAGDIFAGAAKHPDVATGVGAGILRSPIQAAAGLADFAGDVGHAISPHLDPRNYEGRISNSGVHFRYAPTTDTYSGFGADISHLRHVGNETANQLAANTASIAIGYGAGAKLAQAVGAAPRIASFIEGVGNPVARTAATIATRAAGAAAADAVVLDPETERFSNVLQNLGVRTQFTDWLAHDDKEGHLAGRFKNAVEGLGLGAATDSLLQAGSYWRARLRGDHATADAIQSELAAKHDGEVPDYAIEEHPGAPEAPKGEAQEPGYVGGWEEAETGAVRPVYEEDPLKGAPADVSAKAADDEAQAAQQGADGGAGNERGGGGQPPASADAQPQGATTGGQGSTGGPVRPMSPEAMAKAMRDPEAAGGIASDPIVTFTAKRTPDDPPRVVGSMDRESIDGLAKDVQFWRSARDAEGDPRAIDVTRDTETGAAHGEFRLGNLGGSQSNVAPLLRAMVDRIPETAPRTDAELMRDAARASAELGEDPASLLEAARLISGKLSDADTAMATIRSVWVKAEKNLDALPDMDWETATDADVEQAAQRIHNMMLISGHVQEAKAGLGRGLRVNQLPDVDSYLNTVRKADKAPDGTTTGVQGPLPRTRPELKDWFDLWQSTKGDPETRAAFLEGALTRIVPSAQKYLRNSFANFFTASILSAPRTLLLNLVGPAAMSVIRNVERQSGALVGAALPWKSPEERQAAMAVARATSTAYLQTFGDIADTMRWAWQAAQRNKTIIGGGQTIDAQAAFGPWTENLIEAARPDVSNAEKAVYSLGNAINMWPRAVQRINNGFDEFSKRLAYMGEVRVRAITEGLQQGLSGDDLRALVKQRLQSSVNDVGHATEDDVLREAERTTLTYKTGEEGGLLRKGYDYINQVRRDIPETRYLLPVLGVPANTLGEALRRLPIAAMPGVNRVLWRRTADELAGNFGPVLQADAHGRMITGASFLMGGIMLNRMGLLTGAGPQDPTDRKVWLMEHQPYSIRVGDKWVRYDKYDVLGGLLSIPSTISDATLNIREDKGYGDMLLSGVGALAQWFKDRAALRGAAGLLALGDDPTSSASSVFSQTAGGIAQGLIPNAIQAPITQALDPYQRMKRSWEDYLKAAIPGLSSQLPPVRNILGEPVQRPANSVGEGLFPVTIAPAVTFKEDPVVDEIDRVYQVTGYGAGADPKALGYGFFNPKDIQLENGQTLYDAGMQARQTMQINGKTLRQALGELFHSEEYNQAVDGDPGQATTSRGDAVRGYMLKAVFDRYNKQIKAELAEASPTANRWLTAAAAKQRDDAYLRDVSVQDLANNPSYYHSHGIDGAVYSDKVREGASGALIAALQRR